MKSLLLALILACSVPSFTGCRNPERTALTTVKIEATTVTTAMQAFVQYEKIHGATAELRRKVDAAYQKVRTTNLAAESAWLDYRVAKDGGSPDTPKALAIYQATLVAVTAAANELIAIVNSLPK